jgi:hypothetical protein
MRLRRDETISRKPVEERGDSLIRKKSCPIGAKAAAALFAAACVISPFAENRAYAQDSRPASSAQAQDAGTSRQPEIHAYSGIVSQNTIVLSMSYSERVMGEQVFPSTAAELKVANIDRTGVEFSLLLLSTSTSVPADPVRFRMNYDGTSSGNTSVLVPLGIEGLTVASADGGRAQVDFTYTDAPASARPRPADGPGNEVEIGTPRVVRPEGDDFRDRSLSFFQDEVSLSGRERPFTLNNRWDVGGTFYSNEGGQSIWGSVRYAIRSSDSRPFTLRVDAGNMWFGRQEAPFIRLFVRPELNVWRFKGVYYGSVAAVAEMPSWLYTSHSLGIGYSQPIGENFRLRMGFIAGGALSYPTWDDIYFQMAGGVSAEFYNVLVYGMVNSFFAAPDPIKTAFVGYYRPYFQNAEVGIQYRFYEDQYTVRVFGDIGLLNQRVGGRITRSMDLSDSISGDFWIGGGATHWANEVGGRWDPMVLAGINLVFGGRSINSTNRAEFDHQGRGGTEQVQTDLPTSANPGVYGYGRSGNAAMDAQVNRAKEGILEAGSFQEFSNGYASATTNEKIMAARFLGAFLQQVAYANGAMDALNNTDFFNSEVQRIAGNSTGTMFTYIQRYVQFYNSHEPGAQLPEDLRNGIAVCAGIHQVMAEFLRSNGIPTIVASVNTPNGPHVIAVARPPGSTVLLDYGGAYAAPENSFDEVIRSYGQFRRAPTFQSQLFNQDGYFTTYETAEGRLLHRSIGIVNMRALGRDFLGVR